MHVRMDIYIYELMIVPESCFFKAAQNTWSALKRSLDSLQSTIGSEKPAICPDACSKRRNVRIRCESSEANIGNNTNDRRMKFFNHLSINVQ